MSVARLTRLTKDLTSLAPWAVPGSILAGWMAWPALTPAFKEQTLGLKPTPVSMTLTSGNNKDVFRSSGKYKYVKSEIGEPPVLEEE
ncbi:uncharacterized protein PHALS_09132 [Plasmopara halstedii]|uniref:Uncharacterized protein n=1 Tax=Plasmopara halstedii TaxID=4781 RepID=A0A0P1AF09_PLAHL|nr:uncharacterized protein PHALS_09132 [Plasmopara halstedii]CEG39070.1 hypothetical protein PHALS_09132 [Plasmopara halstedii]|eukprot:XP_024575439.1 hypothetical protein PHALS_09132 [Plasmopara halstedii]